MKVATGPTWLRYFKPLRQEQSIYIVENLNYYAVSIQNYCKYTWLTYGRDHSFPRKSCFPVRIVYILTPLFSTPPKKLSQVFHSVLVAPPPYTDKKKKKETYVAQARLLRSIMYADETVSRRFQYPLCPAWTHAKFERTNEKGKGGVWCSYKPSFFCKRFNPPSAFPFRGVVLCDSGKIIQCLNGSL